MNYHFFDFGFVDLLIVAEEHRRRGIGVALLDYLSRQCKTEKLFTSTNESNTPMRKLLVKAGFIPCGQIDALDDGDPELFFVKKKSEMNLNIKPLTTDLIADYLEFFDNRVFSDGNPCGPCYCNAAVMDNTTLCQMESEFGGDIRGTIRRYAVKQLNKGQIHGYLAYDGGKPIGWCNAGDMGIYLMNKFDFIPEFARQSKCGKTISVVCFAIAPEYRGMGVATALLERVVSDAKEQGFAAVEGYAKVQKNRVYYDYNGPVRLYEKAGFTEVATQEGRVVMRKVLEGKGV